MLTRYKNYFDENTQCLNLSEINLDHDGLQFLLDDHPNPPTIKVLKLTLHSFAFHFFDQYMPCLMQIIKKQVSLTELHIDLNNNIVVDAGKSAFRHFHVSPRMSWEDKLKECARKALVPFAEAIAAHTNLKVLCISGSDSHCGLAKYLAEALKENATLTHFTLQGFVFTDQDAIALSETLSANDTVVSLELIGKGLSEIGMTSFARLLEKNSTLTHLDLTGQTVAAHVENDLLMALKANTTLTSLRYDHDLTNEISTEIRKKLEQNAVWKAQQRQMAKNKFLQDMLIFLSANSGPWNKTVNATPDKPILSELPLELVFQIAELVGVKIGLNTAEQSLLTKISQMIHEEKKMDTLRFFARKPVISCEESDPVNSLSSRPYPSPR